jgi:hypothetical protein
MYFAMTENKKKITEEIKSRLNSGIACRYLPG